MGPCVRRDDKQREAAAKGATMEDLKVTANGYDFKPAQAAMQAMSITTCSQAFPGRSWSGATSST
jgi:hypothetical protein